MMEKSLCEKSHISRLYVRDPVLRDKKEYERKQRLKIIQQQRLKTIYSTGGEPITIREMQRLTGSIVMKQKINRQNPNSSCSVSNGDRREPIYVTRRGRESYPPVSISKLREDRIL